MKLFYVGKNGKLNILLSARMKPKPDAVLRARGIEKINVPGFVVWGGRDFNVDLFDVDLSKVRLVFLSTFHYNDFSDAYQIRKLEDEEIVKRIGGSIVNIPFINEFHESILSGMTTKFNSGFYVCSCSIDDIAEHISAIYHSREHELRSIKSNVIMSKNDQRLWNTFSCLYRFSNRIQIFKLRYFSLKLIKILEKVSQKIFGSHTISSVFIGKSNG